jgi:DNA repair ATPase RecN
MLVIRDLEFRISHLEGLIQEISSEILANVLYEKAPPSKLLADSEGKVGIIKKTAEDIKDTILLLKPERTPSIRRAFRDFIQPINSFIEILKNPEQTQNATRQALDLLRKAVAQSQDFISLSRDIAKNPSKIILEVMRLKEVSEAKDYLSKVSVPEAVYTRLEHLRERLEALRSRILNLEQTAGELLKYMDRLEEEISRFQQPQ